MILKAFAQDPFSLKQRTDYVGAIYRDMMAQDLFKSNKATQDEFISIQIQKTLPQIKRRVRNTYAA